jgi:hypothetical protein
MYICMYVCMYVCMYKRGATRKRVCKINCKNLFLGAFAKLRKGNTRFDMSVCLSVLSISLSVNTEELGFHWTDFR